MPMKWRFCFARGQTQRPRISPAGHHCTWQRERGRKDAVVLLLDNGADINATDKWGYSVLHRALHDYGANVAELLLARGAYVRTQSQSGETPLHVVAYSGSTRVVEMLLAQGADPNAKGEDDKTPLDIAQEAGFVDIIRLLGGDVAKAESGPYRVMITDPNAIQLFLDRSMTVDGVWVPDEAQLKELEAVLSRYLRERAAPDNGYQYALMYLRRHHREYGGFVSKGRKYIACNLNRGGLSEKPLPNRFTGRYDTEWGQTRFVFDADNRTIVEVSNVWR